MAHFSLLFLEKAKFFELQAAIDRAPGQIDIVSIKNTTLEGDVLEAIFENNPKVRHFVTIGDIVGQRHELAYVDDYVERMARWSLQRDSQSGRDLRESFTFLNEISAWWLFSFTEKNTSSDPLELFKGIVLLRHYERLHGKPACAEYLGEARLRSAIEGAFRDLGFRVGKSVASERAEPVEPALFSRIRNGRALARSLVPIGRVVVESVVSKKQSRRQRPIVVLSEFPHSWKSDPSVTAGEYGDFYLHSTIVELDSRFGADDRLEVGLVMRLGPAVLPVNSQKIRQAEKLARDCYYNRIRAGTDRVSIVDRSNSLRDRLLTETWRLKVLRNVLPRVRAGAYGRMEYLGVDLTDYFIGLMEDELAGVVPRSLATGLAVSRYLKSLGARVCLYRNELYSGGRVLTWAAKRAGACSVGIQHGGLSRRHGVYQFDPSEIPQDFSAPDQVRKPPMPTLFGVWGRWFQEAITEKSGYPRSQVPIFGCQRIAQLRRLAQEPSVTETVEFCRKQGIRESMAIVVFATQAEPQLDAMLLFLRSVDPVRDKVFVIVKTHPLNPLTEPIRKLLQRFPGIRHMVTDVDLAGLLRCSDAVVTCASSVGYEVLALGKPLFSIILSNHDAYLPFTQFSSLAREVRTAEELTLSLQELSHRISLGREKPEKNGIVAGQSVLSMDETVNSKVFLAAIEGLLERGPNGAGT